MTFSLIAADCIPAMQAMAENSVDAIVTDPPYGLEFMGKEWDKFSEGRAANYAKGGEMVAVDMPGTGFTQLPTQQRPAKRCANCGKQSWSGSPCTCPEPRWELDNSPLLSFQSWCTAWATEALRILKPGGHLLAFGGTRTYHRLACAIEDAGFEIRDCIAWMYGSGFPKSLDVSKAIDKAAGGEGEWSEREGDTARVRGSSAILGQAVPGPSMTYAPATPDAQRWNGWGTALKPAFEPIVLARKPLSERNVAANVQKHGTGALNVDGCRIGTDEIVSRGGIAPGAHNFVNGPTYDREPTTSVGRWPANVTLDETAAAMLDEQTGEVGGGFGVRGQRTRGEGWATRGGDVNSWRSTGGASRFFYCPKADREERNRGLEGFAESLPLGPNGSPNAVGATRGSLSLPRANHHPTVKPVELMRWLCRMVTPKGGTVLDPFTGSGSTGVAAMREGFEFIGIEREAEYVEIARARIIGDAPLFNVEAI